jgi:hypothetical protein
MKSHREILIALLFTIIMAGALVGGSWQIGYGQGTVPPAPPAAPVKPATGADLIAPGTAAVSPAMKGCTDVTAELLDSARKTRLQVVAQCKELAEGESILLAVIDPVTDTRVQKVTPLTEVVNVGVYQKPDAVLSGPWSHTWTLKDAELDAFKKDSAMGVLWFDKDANKWVKLDAVVKGNQVTVESSKTGLFTIGKSK